MSKKKPGPRKWESGGIFVTVGKSSNKRVKFRWQGNDTGLNAEMKDKLRRNMSQTFPQLKTGNWELLYADGSGPVEALINFPVLDELMWVRKD